MGSFLTGKRSFVVLKLVGGSFLGYQSLIEALRAQAFVPIPADKTYRESAIRPDGKLQEDYVKEYENLAGGDFILFDLLYEERKANPEIIKRRFLSELKKHVDMMRSTNRAWKPDSAFKSDLRSKICHEEDLKAQPKEGRISVALNLGESKIMIGTKSEAAIDKVTKFIIAFLVTSSSTTTTVPALEMFAADGKDMGPLHFNPNQIDYAADAISYSKQWLTWITARAAANSLGAIKDEDRVQAEPLLSGYVKFAFRDGAKLNGVLKTFTTPGQAGIDGREKLAQYCVEHIRSGAIVEEVAIRLPLDVFGEDDKRTFVKLTTPFFLSDINVAFPPDAGDDALIDFTLEACLKLADWVTNDSEKFVTDRLDKRNWSENMASMRDLIKNVADGDSDDDDLEEVV